MAIAEHIPRLGHNNPPQEPNFYERFIGNLFSKTETLWSFFVMMYGTLMYQLSTMPGYENIETTDAGKGVVEGGFLMLTLLGLIAFFKTKK